MRYILKANGASPAEADNLKKILDGHRAQLVDGSMLPDMALVDVDDKQAAQLRSQLGDQWTFFPEKTYTVPDTRKKIRK